MTYWFRKWTGFYGVTTWRFRKALFEKINKIFKIGCDQGIEI